jgi:hypothetical protein
VSCLYKLSPLRVKLCNLFSNITFDLSITYWILLAVGQTKGEKRWSKRWSFNGRKHKIIAYLKKAVRRTVRLLLQNTWKWRSTGAEFGYSVPITYLGRKDHFLPVGCYDIMIHWFIIFIIQVRKLCERHYCNWSWLAPLIVLDCP